jgi:hypothetical protein
MLSFKRRLERGATVRFAQPALNHTNRGGHTFFGVLSFEVAIKFALRWLRWRRIDGWRSFYNQPSIAILLQTFGANAWDAL